MKRFLLLLLLTGCTAKTTYIPVAAKCHLPNLPIEPSYIKYPARPTPGEGIKTMLINYEICRSDNKKLRLFYKNLQN
jgi:hypothetical protein